MPYILLDAVLPEVAEQETRIIAVYPAPPSSPPSSSLPSANYVFCEMFCDELKCDCRRVMFSVVSSRTQKTEAVIAYGWETREFYVKWLGYDDPMKIEELMGPALNLTSPQSIHASEILDLAEQVLLSDQDYVDRLKRHYKLFRAALEPHKTRFANSSERKWKSSKGFKGLQDVNRSKSKKKKR